MLNTEHEQNNSSGSFLGQVEASTENSALQAEKQFLTLEMKTTHNNGPNASEEVTCQIGSSQP